MVFTNLTTRSNKGKFNCGFSNNDLFVGGFSNLLPSLHFVSSWKTDNTGTSDDDQITLPLESGGTYNFNVDWGDGSNDDITAYDDAAVTHTYSSSGTYTVTIAGTINGFRFNSGGDRQKILNISNWGNLLLGNSGGYFYNCVNLTVTATDILNTSSITTMENGFRGCTSLATVPNMGSWDMSNVTNMNFTFRDSTLFNQPIDSWDMSSVTTMNSMFFSSSAFNQPISSWDVSSVTTATNMFRSSAFNQPIGSWNVTNLLTTTNMFFQNSAFDQDISNWNVINLTSAANMFFQGALSTANYDLLLIGWEQLTLQNTVGFGVGTTEYSAGAAATARASIISTYSWTITDGGEA